MQHGEGSGISPHFGDRTGKADCRGARLRTCTWLTHDFYKYPARFSPVFARAAIETFTEAGSTWCLIRMSGAQRHWLRLARQAAEAVGVDISPLAEFVAQVKCTIFSDAELKKLRIWAARLPNAIDIHRPSSPFIEYARSGIL